MNPIKLIQKILNAKALESGSKWQASHKVDGVQTAERPVVKRFTCGLKDGEVWFRYEFAEAGADHDLRGTFSFKNENEQITFDDQQVEADDVIVSHRVVGFKVRGLVEFEFQHEGHTHRYRFDATVASIV